MIGYCRFIPDDFTSQDVILLFFMLDKSGIKILFPGHTEIVFQTGQTRHFVDKRLCSSVGVLSFSLVKKQPRDLSGGVEISKWSANDFIFDI